MTKKASPVQKAVKRTHRTKAADKPAQKPTPRKTGQVDTKRQLKIQKALYEIADAGAL